MLNNIIYTAVFLILKLTKDELVKNVSITQFLINMKEKP